MTVTSEITSIVYSGNGIQTAFTFDFLIPSNVDGSAAVSVVFIDAGGNATFLSSSDFVITGLNVPSGGTVVYPIAGDPILSTQQIAILRDVPYTQLSAVSNQNFYPHTLEQVGDTAELQIQQLNERAGRALSVLPGEVIGFLPSLANRKGKYLAFDATSGNPVAASGTGGGGLVEWSSILDRPASITAMENLTPASGQIVEYTGAGTAHMIPTPGGGGGVTSVNTRTGAVTLTVSDVNGAPAFGNAVGAVLASGTNVTLVKVAGVTTINAAGGSGGNEPIILSAFGSIDGGGTNTTSNNAALTAAEAATDSAIYLPDGIYATTNAENTFSKNYQGRGRFKFPSSGGDILPAKYSYMATQPTPGGVGRTGWFSGDQRFTDQEYKVIGPGVREFNVNGPGNGYYESNTIPHNSWMDVMSGNSGTQSFLIFGATIGATTIALPGPADASWVGKTVGFGFYGTGAVTESHVVSAVNVAGNNIVLATAITANYVWNPGGAPPTIPQIFFAPRTWAGRDYLLLRASGGGDFYGHNVRSTSAYVPKATELQHPFMASTVSQYGGDVNALSSGNYLQSWESQIQGGVYDNTAISFVQSMVRNFDQTLRNGRFWAGTYFTSSGTRPADVGHTLTGSWRNGLDMAGSCAFIEVGYLDGANGSTTFQMVNTNGVHPGDPITIGELPGTVYSGTVISTSAGINVSVTPAITTTFASGTVVKLSKGGAAINMNPTQRIIFNSSLDATYRSSDATGVYPTFYGNKQGDVIMGCDTDVGGEFWSVRYARGPSNTLPDTARIRMRPTSVQIYGTGVHTVNGTGFALAAGCDFGMAPGQILGLGGACYLIVSGGHILATSNGGGSFVTIV